MTHAPLDHLQPGDLVRIGSSRKEYRFRGVAEGPTGKRWIDLYGPLGRQKAKFCSVRLDAELHKVRVRKSRPR